MKCEPLDTDIAAVTHKDGEDKEENVIGTDK